MKTTQLNPASAGAERATLNDIVFEFRNKAYGAYDLRQNYPTALRNALILGITLFLMMFLVPMLYSEWKQVADMEQFKGDTKTILVELDPTVKPIVEPPKVEIPPKQATERFITPEVKTEAPDETELPPVEKLEHAAISDVTQAGNDDETNIVEAPVDAPKEEVKAAEIKVEEPMETYRIELQPEFMGGQKAMMEYLYKNLKYPNPAIKSGVSGRVHLQFTIEPDGSLSNVSVLKGIGFGCDEEAMRVVKLMPNWKPGKQSGRAVRVKFNLPIVFSLE